MLKLTGKQFVDAVETMGDTLEEAELSGVTTRYALAIHILEALGLDFDVSPLDPGPDNDVEEGNVWPRESDRDLSLRAFGTHFGRRSWI